MRSSRTQHDGRARTRQENRQSYVEVRRRLQGRTATARKDWRIKYANAPMIAWRVCGVANNLSVILRLECSSRTRATVVYSHHAGKTEGRCISILSSTLLASINSTQYISKSPEVLKSRWSSWCTSDSPIVEFLNGHTRCCKDRQSTILAPTWPTQHKDIQTWWS